MCDQSSAFVNGCFWLKTFLMDGDATGFFLLTRWKVTSLVFPPFIEIRWAIIRVDLQLICFLKSFLSNKSFFMWPSPLLLPSSTTKNKQKTLAPWWMDTLWMRRKKQWTRNERQSTKTAYKMNTMRPNVQTIFF